MIFKRQVCKSCQGSLVWFAFNSNLLLCAECAAELLQSIPSGVPSRNVAAAAVSCPASPAAATLSDGGIRLTKLGDHEGDFEDASLDHSPSDFYFKGAAQ